MTTPMPPDLRELAAHERELARRDQRAPIWLDVVTGVTDPDAVTPAMAGAVDESQLARDRALFRPLSPELRARLLHAATNDSSAARRWRGPLVIGIVAAAAILTLVVAPLARDTTPTTHPDPLPLLAQNLALEVELIAGDAATRSTTDAARPVRIQQGRQFRLEVRLPTRAFTVARLIAHCGDRDVVLRHRVASQARGFVNLVVTPDPALRSSCSLEIVVDLDGALHRVPPEQWPELEVTP